MDLILESVNHDDQFFDYCHYQYAPVGSTTGKLRSSSLLFHSFAVQSLEPEFFPVVKAIRAKIGENNTVWGIKQINGRLVHEFYFYNATWEPKDRLSSVAGILEAIAPYYHCNVRPNEQFPYFMFSLDFQPGFSRQKIPGIHLYIGSFAYYCNGNGMALENHYSFYSPGPESGKIYKDVWKSAFVDYSTVNIQEVLIPELLSCKSICRSHKPHNDGIYYSGISLAQFQFFLEKFQYPEPIIGWVNNHQDRLDHLQYDIGFDYTMENGQIKILKSGYYGVF
jgi:hypothetical protein